MQKKTYVTKKSLGLIANSDGLSIIPERLPFNKATVIQMQKHGIVTAGPMPSACVLSFHQGRCFLSVLMRTRKPRGRAWGVWELKPKFRGVAKNQPDAHSTFHGAPLASDCVGGKRVKMGGVGDGDE
jgi:hypothetical protein